MSHLHAGKVLSAEVDAAELVAELVLRNVLRLSGLRPVISHHVT